MHYCALSICALSIHALLLHSKLLKRLLCTLQIQSNPSIAKRRKEESGHGRDTPNPAPSFLSPEANTSRAVPRHQCRSRPPQQGTPSLYDSPALPAAETIPNTNQLYCVPQPQERSEHSRACKRHCGTPTAAEGEGRIDESRAPTSVTCKEAELSKGPLSPLNGFQQKQGPFLKSPPRHCLSSAKTSAVPKLRTGHRNQENVAPPF